MTEPDPLPGLEPPARTAGALERAVHRTITALNADEPLLEKLAAHTALVVKLAQIIDDKHASGRMSTVGNDARVLVDLLEALAPVEAGGPSVDQELAAAVAAWKQAATEVGHQ